MTVWDLIKRASNEKMWKRGEDLKDNVFSVYQDEHEWEILVQEGQKKHEVYIGIDAKEWDCSCGSKIDPIVVLFKVLHKCGAPNLQATRKLFFLCFHRCSLRVIRI